MSDDRELESAATTLPESDIVLMARICKAIADTDRVANFIFNVNEKEAVARIFTTWGSMIEHTQPRPDWRLAVTKALDELDEIKPETVPDTDDKE